MAARICIAVLAGLAALSLVPATAPAKPCHRHHHSPAGNSEAEQYSETVPGACGNETPRGGAGGGSPSSIPPSTLRQLQALGTDGQAAASFAQQTGPGGRVARHADRGAPAGAASGRPGAGEGTSDGNGFPSSVIDALTQAFGGESDNGGMGILLPLILAAVAAAGIGFAIVRRRAGPE